jgi:hypothetical protein
VDDFNLSNDFYYSLFAGNSLKIRHAAVGSTESLDWPNQEYVHNSYGFRGKEFSGSDDLVVAGCSYTYGVGVPVESVWWNQVCDKLGLSASAPVAKPGASVAWIVERLFAYFAEFGHPKYLLCLFPDPYRIIVPIDGEVLTAENVEGGLLGETGSFGINDQRLYGHHIVNQPSTLRPKYSKKPHDIKDFYTVQISVFEAVRAIRFLEQYCSAVGINLQWTTWHDAFNDYIEKVNKVDELKFKRFFDLGILNRKEAQPSGVKDVIFRGNRHVSEPFIESCPIDCHEDLKKLYGEQNYNLGTDTSRGEENSHPGIHVHAHFADRFVEQLMLEYPHEFK